MNKKTLITLLTAVALLLIGGSLWWALRPKPIKLAVVNVPDFMLARMVQAADPRNISIEPEEDVQKLKHYDAVLIFGMGLQFSPQDRESVRALDNKQIPYLSMMTTNADNSLCNVDSVKRDSLFTYLTNGGTANYRSGLNYLRQEIVGKKLRSGEILPAVQYPADLLFTPNTAEFEDLAFASVADYQKFYTQHGYKEGAPKVALVAGFAGPFMANREHYDEIISALQERGMNVYPMATMMKRVEFLSQVDPDLVIYMPHGRLGMGNPDRMLAYLKEQNVPVLAPVTLNNSQEEWEADPQGMLGGFLSQSVVTPELDGAIVPFALVTLQPQGNGLKLYRTIPDRLPLFCDLVARYIKLQSTPNNQKRLAIYYFKGPGNNSLTAQGLETLPSLYNLLLSLRNAGYKVDNLPDSQEGFEALVMKQGALFNSYAQGAQSRFMQEGNPAFVPGDTLAAWIKETFPQSLQDSITRRYGQAPGNYLTKQVNGQECLALTRIELGNVVLIPQPGVGSGSNDFKMVHGSTSVPAYPYIAAYLWAQKAFKADAALHFGTHGSLEFVPGKQVALSSKDYTDRLIGAIPHFYYYTTANVGEAIIAKRRSYAQLISYLAPPFMLSGLDASLAPILDKTQAYLEEEKDNSELSLQIKQLVLKARYHKDLGLDSLPATPYTRDEIQKISDYVQELATARVTSGLYTTGIPFKEEKIRSAVSALSVDPVAYALASLDKCRQKITDAQIKNQTYYTTHYLRPATQIVNRLLNSPQVDTRQELLRAGFSLQEIQAANQSLQPQTPPAAMGKHPGGHPGGNGGHPGAKPGHPGGNGGHPGAKPGHPGGNGGSSGQPDPTSQAVLMMQTALENIPKYRALIKQSPQMELQALLNALNGGFTSPSPGGDFVASPSVLPTGRNLYSIDPERTPSPAAWKHGQELADALIADYRKRNQGAYPQKVSFTLWSSSFIESEGTTIAQILYLLGVEPIRDRSGKILDVSLIPEEKLGRPRIDVVVQTSGQLRDLASSRLFLIQKAVSMAAEAPHNRYPNHVAQGVKDAERVLLEEGLPAAQARALSSARIFGGMNGSYGTGIQSMVEAGDRWEERSQIAETYLQNMGAVYGSQESWGSYSRGLFKAALQNTDAVVQPRQSNTWGALSLDHVYEFMGGLSLAVEEVTGKVPEAYFSDLRNRHRVRTQEVKEAIGVEARTTILNPAYLKEQMKEGASAAGGLAETIRNTYSWNVMRPTAIDAQLWEDIYQTFVEDASGLGIKEFFSRENPAALQDYTAAMLETVRKGLWQASPRQIEKMAQLHAQSIKDAGAGCSGMVCNNAKLQQFISQKLSPEQAQEYKAGIERILHAQEVDAQSGRVLRQESTQADAAAPAAHKPVRSALTTWLIVGGGVLLLAVIVVINRRRKRSAQGTSQDKMRE